MRQEDRNPPRRGSFAIHQPSSTRVDKPLPKIPSANSASTAQYLLPSNAKATSPAAVSPNFDTGCQGTHILNLGSYGVWVCNDPRPLPGTLASWRIFEHLDDPVLMIEPIAAVPEAADQSQGTKKSRLSKIFRMGRRSQQATQGIATSLSDTHVATGPHGSTPPANVETIPAIGDSNTTLRPFTPTCDLLLEAELQHIHDRRQEAARHLRDDIVQYFRGNQTCSSASLAPSFRQWLSMTHQPDSRPRDLQDGKAGHSDHPVTVVSSAAAATNRPPRSLQALWSLCNPHNKRPTTPQVAGEAERMNANRPVPAGDQWETRAVAALAWQKLLTDGKLPIRLLETILDSAQEDGVLSVRKVEAPKVEMADQGLSGAQYLYAAQDSDNDSTFTAGSWDGSI
ncbi:hypothetical protein IWQ60_003547 [Tieghemiomyces parasiticus]|uniref:Uncharacterized protein n=1 Tax=Tieghemiomyces parasiticus TaxID=78921 RepID=A0A9W8AHB5_9FUNG|nr:hypothetical protein IWQ60_003547 [Tieghemiomyces parasiticus]